MAVLAVSGVLLVVIFVAIGVITWRASQTPKGQQALRFAGEVYSAQNAPGTKDVRALGCDQAVAFDMKKITDMADIVDARALDTQRLASRMVLCVVKRGRAAPTCDAVALAYARGASPSSGFIASVSVADTKDPLCSSFYESSGAFAASASSAR